MSAAPVVELEGWDAGDLDAVGVLEAAAEAETAERHAALRKLQLAYRWAVLHPASPESGVATPGGPALDVLTLEESLGGDGTPAVAAFTPETFAAHLAITPAAGAQLIGDALDLVHRHPLLWARVVGLEVPAWQARRVTRQTHPLPLEGALWVDERLAARTDGGCGPVITDRLVADAVARFDPEAHEQREDHARASWDVRLSHPAPIDFAGTSDLQMRGDSATLTGFHDLVNAIAHRLFRDGDTAPLGVRKITAVRLITAAARGEANLEVSTTRTGRIKVYVRVEARDLDVDATGNAAFAVGEVEKLGAATMARLRDWVGHHQVLIQPVLNMARRDAVDQHDPPGWMRELVILRDRHCIFPRCTFDARRCDLDHQTPYQPDGPPGQTRPDNLASLCRRHHRAKTLGAWRYTRTPEGHYHWHGPHGRGYLVTPAGTHNLGGPGDPSLAGQAS